MSTQHNTDAEAFQLFLAEQVAGGVVDRSPEEILKLWRDRERESAGALRAIREGLSDIDAGRTYPFDEVNDEIRRQQGWQTSQ